MSVKPKKDKAVPPPLNTEHSPDRAITPLTKTPKSPNTLKDVEEVIDSLNLKQIGQYRIGKALGEGTFGTVRLGQHMETKQKVAIKILEKTKIAQMSDVGRVAREIKILQSIRHPNIIELYEVIDTN